MVIETFKVKYIGKDKPTLRNGDIYDATYLIANGKISDNGYSVTNNEGETFAYHKSLFEKIN